MTNYEKVKSIKGIPLEEVPAEEIVEHYKRLNKLIFVQEMANLADARNYDPYYPETSQKDEEKVWRWRAYVSDLRNEMVRRIMENV